MRFEPVTTRSRRARTGALRILLAMLALAVSISFPSPPHAAASSRPNIVLILTDDQRWDTLSQMPRVGSLLRSKGVTFTNAYVVNPLCCPSRTTILTGQPSHSTGVYTNFPPTGGFPAFHLDRSTVATWLRATGYHTALVGKYLNEYRTAALQHYVPPGWERWVAFAEDNGRYYNYDLTVDGRIVHHADRPQDYSTNVLARQAVSFIHETRGPLFLYFATAAPHDHPTPAPGDADACPGLPKWRPPNYNEGDISDKPRWVRRPLMTPKRSGYVAAFRTNQCRALKGVDRSVERIVEALKATGRLSNTMIVFMSDNGFLWGEHRIMGKEAPYEESIRVPMVIRYDPITGPGRKDPHLVLNMDLARTIADVAGTSSPGAQGRSLLPHLRSPNTPGRHDFLIEHARAKVDIPPYCAVHTERAIYVLYGTGEQELYDLQDDPYELQNVVHRSSESDRVAALRHRLNVICNERPPGW
jgi:N-acetylglucosamine-6-sulfatase